MLEVLSNCSEYLKYENWTYESVSYMGVVHIKSSADLTIVTVTVNFLLVFLS